MMIQQGSGHINKNLKYQIQFRKHYSLNKVLMHYNNLFQDTIVAYNNPTENHQVELLHTMILAIALTTCSSFI